MKAQCEICKKVKDDIIIVINRDSKTFVVESRFICTTCKIESLLKCLKSDKGLKCEERESCQTELKLLRGEKI